jgi:RNA polymerase-binding transcription factor DksA
MTLAGAEAEKVLTSWRKALDEHERAREAQHASRDADTIRELREIDAALARIAAGTYGTCERCGGAIGRDRLRALPEVRCCLGCAG